MATAVISSNFSGEEALSKWRQDLAWRCEVLESALHQLTQAITIRIADDGTILYQNDAARSVELAGKSTEFVTTQQQPVGSDERLQVTVQESLSAVRNPLLRHLMDSGHIPFSIAFPDGQVEYLSQAVYARTGKTHEELMGWGYASAVHPDDAATVTTDWLIAVGKKQPYVSKEFRVFDDKGGVYWLVFSTTPIYNDYGCVARWVGVSNDVTELVKVRQAAEAERTVFQTAMDQLPVGLIVARAPSGEVCMVNRKAKEVSNHLLNFSSSPEGVEKIRWAPFHEDGRRFEKWDWPLARCLMRGEPVGPEHLRYLRTDETVGTVSSTATPVYSPVDEKMIAVVACIEDVTDQLKAEEQKARLMAAEHATKATTELLANVSHELRTPLNAVIGMAELLFATGTLNNEQKEYVQVIREAGGLLLTVIGEVLDHEKLRAHKLELDLTELNIKSVIEGVCTLMHEMATKADVRLECIVDETLCKRMLRGDEQRLKQIIMNLLSNAIRFTPAGGQVTIRAVTIAEDDSVTGVRVEVSDTGIGMDEATQMRLFKPFMQADSSTTRRFGGTGLGLAICKHLIDLMHGKIGAFSESNKGSCFWFELPMQRCGRDIDATASNAPHSTACSAVPVGSSVVCAPLANTAVPDDINKQEVRVLVAEDNRVNRLLIQRMLRNAGFAHVTLVSDGKQAFDAVVSGDFDIVLMDCQMPVMDGYEATRLIRALADQRKASIPIVALTASALPADVQRSVQAGMSGHVSKPYTSQVLLATMAKLLLRP